MYGKILRWMLTLIILLQTMSSISLSANVAQGTGLPIQIIDVLQNDHSITAIMENVSNDQLTEIVLIMACYNDASALVDMKTVAIENINPEATIETTIMFNETFSHIKLFTWNSISSMTSISNVYYVENNNDEGISTSEPPFIPGEGGALAIPNFTANENEIGILYIAYNQYTWPFTYGGQPSIRNELALHFQPADNFDGTGYTLQYSENGETNWNSYAYQDTVVTTSAFADNLYIEYALDGYYRLLLSGGEKDRYTSNVVRYELSQTKGEFSSWSFAGDCSGVGDKVVFSLTFKNYEDTDNIVYFTDEHMDFQWYRVNPITYEMSIIEGAVNREYTVTDADKGYKILLRVTGDNIHVSGFYQHMFDTIVCMNESYIANVCSTGFDLNMKYMVNGLTAEDFELYGSGSNWSNQIDIVSVSQDKENHGIYRISFNEIEDISSLNLYTVIELWSIASYPSYGHHDQGLSEGVEYYEISHVNIYDLESDTEYTVGSTISTEMNGWGSVKYTWYRADDSNGSNPEIIELPTEDEYGFTIWNDCFKPTGEDLGKYIFVVVSSANINTVVKNGTSNIIGPINVCETFSKLS